MNSVCTFTAPARDPAARFHNAPDANLLHSDGTPPELLPQARAWFERQMRRAAQSHGSRWPEHREWVADYFNEELRERLADREVRNGV